MDNLLKALNQLVADRIIESFAIGGAIGASLYIDALQTEDVDAFTVLPEQRGGRIFLPSHFAKGKMDERYVGGQGRIQRTAKARCEFLRSKTWKEKTEFIARINSVANCKRVHAALAEQLKLFIQVA